MVTVADLTRAAFMNGDISTVMSPRTVHHLGGERRDLRRHRLRLPPDLPQQVRRARAADGGGVLPALLRQGAARKRGQPQPRLTGAGHARGRQAGARPLEHVDTDRRGETPLGAPRRVDLGRKVVERPTVARGEGAEGPSRTRARARPRCGARAGSASASPAARPHGRHCLRVVLGPRGDPPAAGAPARPRPGRRRRRPGARRFGPPPRCRARAASVAARCFRTVRRLTTSPIPQSRAEKVSHWSGSPVW